MEGDILFDQESHVVEGNEDLENVAEKGQDAFLDNNEGRGKLVGCCDVVVDGGKDDEDEPTGGNEDDEKALHEEGISDDLPGEEDGDVLHEGGCHCSAVRWRVRASPLPTGERRYAWDMTSTISFFLQWSNATVLSAEQNRTTTSL